MKTETKMTLIILIAIPVVIFTIYEFAKGKSSAKPKASIPNTNNKSTVVSGIANTQVPTGQIIPLSNIHTSIPSATQTFDQTSQYAQNLISGNIKKGLDFQMS